MYVHLSLGFLRYLGNFRPRISEIEKSRAEAWMTIQMTSLTSAECAAERNCEKSLF